MTGLTSEFFVAPVAVALAGFAAALLLHWRMWRLLAPTDLVGDESDYLGIEGKTSEPHLWVRVPLFGWLIRLVSSRPAAAPFAAARVTAGVISAAGVAGVAGWVAAVAGPIPATIAMLAVLLSFERAVLALHVWPDTAMGVLLLGFVVCATQDAPVAAALVAALAFGIRIEGAVLCLWAALMPLGGDALTIADTVPAAIALMALLGYTATNGWRYGDWRPDTTFVFNRRVSALARQKPDAPLPEVMRECIAQHLAGAALPQAGKGASDNREAMRRLRQIVGPESFVTQKLLGENPGGYGPGRAVLGAGWANWWLRHGFSVLALTCAPMIPLVPFPVSGALVGGVLLYSAVLSRSRYRMALLPLIGATIGMGLPRVPEAPWMALAGLAVAGVLAWALHHTSQRPEISADTSPNPQSSTRST